jgi:hypothetical protein
MLVYETKVGEYLKTNKVVEKFVQEVDNKICEYYDAKFPSLSHPMIKVELGNKFIKILCDTSCWGFISRIDGDLKGSPIKKGDLLKPASYKAPARHARGNIIDGTAKWGVYGPEYIK